MSDLMVTWPMTHPLHATPMTMCDMHDSRGFNPCLMHFDFLYFLQLKFNLLKILSLYIHSIYV
ncbi:hypothetical protein K435DRAFT_208095 [Dendrothele bispora CBS 962.96]|uniref:Uncharacterized protein n=1 Tax=Dendrothele bispora (strain CBS 962.96) TaxID=1314807 RepID=A0A4S8LSW5_DENBC|nr:hypothetical protein K435DRAFT_208095 [Dendrothele bispora CBS 962.96]